MADNSEYAYKTSADPFPLTPRARKSGQKSRGGGEVIESEVTAEQKRREEEEEEKVMAFPCQGVMGTPIRREDQHLRDLLSSAGEGFALRS